MVPQRRLELKYWVPPAALPALRANLAALLDRDPSPLGEPGRGYRVRSLYFETPRLRFTHEKDDGLNRRLKLRVRVYPSPEGELEEEAPHYWEVKRKDGPFVCKERTALPPRALALLQEERITELLEGYPADSTLRRFVAERQARAAVLPLLVDYRREAFQHPAGKSVYLRATLDQDLRVAGEGRLAKPGALRPILPGCAIFELKALRSPPDWLRRLVNAYDLKPQSISKFAHAIRATYGQRL